MSFDEQSLPEKIGKPALRALLGAGVTNLQQAIRLSDEELLSLHGVGPKAVKILREHNKRIGSERS